MGLPVKFLRAVTVTAQLRLIQPAEGIFCNCLLQYLAAQQITGVVQRLLHLLAHRSLQFRDTEQNLPFQRIHSPSKADSGMGLAYQHISVQMGHMLRFFLTVSPVQQSISFLFCLLCG